MSPRRDIPQRWSDRVAEAMEDGGGCAEAWERTAELRDDGTSDTAMMERRGVLRSMAAGAMTPGLVGMLDRSGATQPTDEADPSAIDSVGPEAPTVPQVTPVPSNPCAIDRVHYYDPAMGGPPSFALDPNAVPVMRIRYEFWNHPASMAGMLMITITGLTSVPGGRMAVPVSGPIPGPQPPDPLVPNVGRVDVRDPTGMGIGYGGTVFLSPSGPIPLGPFGCSGSFFPPGPPDPQQVCYGRENQSGSCMDLRARAAKAGQSHGTNAWTDDRGTPLISKPLVARPSSPPVTDPPGESGTIGWGPFSRDEVKEILGIDSAKPAWLEAAEQAVPAFNKAMSEDEIPSPVQRLLADEVLLRVKRECDKPEDRPVLPEIVQKDGKPVLVVPESEKNRQQDVVLVKIETSASNRITRFEQVDPPADQYTYDQRVETTDCVLKGINQSDNPSESAIHAITSGKITVTGGGIGFGIAKTAAGLRPAPSKYKVNPGETKEITYRGEEGSLSLDEMNRRVFEPADGDMVTFVDKSGAPVGTATKGTQRLIEVGGSEGLTPTAGLYRLHADSAISGTQTLP